MSIAILLGLGFLVACAVLVAAFVAANMNAAPKCDFCDAVLGLCPQCGKASCLACSRCQHCGATATAGNTTENQS